MANVAHATLTGAELHEPKGADTAALGTVYVANGAGSGSWASVGTSAFTGMVADFPSIVAPSGWLELDGSVISTATYSGLFAVLSITTSGTRTNGSPVITSIPSTTNFLAGHYVYGTGITGGLQILSVDSPTQITLNGNASSSGTSSFFVSPWLMGSGTVKLPDTKTSGRYRRSRTATSKVGDVLADQNKAHTHSVSGTSGSESAHTHAISLTSGAMSANASHTHGLGGAFFIAGSASGGYTGGGTGNAAVNPGSIIVGSTNTDHTHSVSGTSAAGSAHTHSFAATSDSDGGTEAQPLTLVLMTCIKT